VSKAYMNYDSGTGEKKNWIIREQVFDREKLGKCEAIFCQGNGYIGQRAALEEKYTAECRNLFVTGTFDRFEEGEVTELPNLADFTNMKIELDGETFSMDTGELISYSRELDLSCGVVSRKVHWRSASGREAELYFERIVSLVEEHVIALRTVIRPLNRKVKVRISSGIDGTKTNTGTQHFLEGTKRIYEGNLMEYTAETGESKVQVVQYAGHRVSLAGKDIHPYFLPVIDRRYLGIRTETEVESGVELCVEKICSVYTSRDMEASEEETREDTQKRSLQAADSYLQRGYTDLRIKNDIAWRKYWDKTDIRMESTDDYDQLAIRFALYHLNIMIKRDDDRVGIGAKGMSGEGYKGHSFWDTEVFLLPFYLFTDPGAARTLLAYRGKSLPGARKKAQENGYEGAMFPWESAWLDNGEVTPLWGAADIVTGESIPILTGKIEQHISADISYAVWEYYTATKDEEFMRKYGYEIILATAVFWADRVEWEGETCHIRDVIGPDEYKEHVDDNAYTNYLVKYNLQLALRVVQKLKVEDPELYLKLDYHWELEDHFKRIQKAEEGIYLPQADENGIIPQYDGYEKLKYLDLTKYKESDMVGTIYEDFNQEQIGEYQVHKQADTVLLLLLFPELVSAKDREKNYEFYEKRTLHDSSLSKSSHALLAAKLGRQEEAYRFFRGCCDTDLGPVMTTSNAGIHSACMGGIWQCVVQGFGGVEIREGRLHIEPKLPEAWKSLMFRIVCDRTVLEVQAAKNQIKISNLGDQEVTVVCGKREEKIMAQENIILAGRE